MPTIVFVYVGDVKLYLDSIGVGFDVIYGLHSLIEIRVSGSVVGGVTYLMSLCCSMEK